MDTITHAISLPLTALLGLCCSLSGGYVSAIILFTLLTKVILFPVSLWTQRNSLKMVALTPELNRLKLKFYGDKDTIAEETQKLYWSHYHPLASTIPMLKRKLRRMSLRSRTGRVKNNIGYEKTWFGRVNDALVGT